MKKLLTIITVLLIGVKGFGTNYYFSMSNGDDSRTSTQAQNKSTPWQHISKLYDFFPSLLPGDSVLFRRGDTWVNETIIIRKSGTVALPIVLGSYKDVEGLNAKPVISGLTPLTSWTNTSGNIWQSATTFTIGSWKDNRGHTFDNLNIVTKTGYKNPLPLGRYPNPDVTTGGTTGYITFESQTTDTSVTAANLPLPSTTNWTGAELALRVARWKIDRNLITNHSSHTIFYNSFAGSSTKPYFGFFIQNDIRTLDRDGEYFYNKSTNKLSLYSASSPVGISVATTAKLLTSSNYSSITVDNIDFIGANQTSIEVSGASGFVINNCKVNYSGLNGMSIGGSNMRITNDTVLNSMSYGIRHSGTGDIISNNLIRNSGIIAGMGESDSAPYQGLEVGGGNNTGGNNLIEYNEIDSTGYNAINFSGGSYQTIKHNYINATGFVKDDAGAGIYTRNVSNYPNIGSKVDSNIVLNGGSSYMGTDLAMNEAVGIYMDDNTHDVEIIGNLVQKYGRGVYLHNCKNIVMRGNSIIDCWQNLHVQHEGLGGNLSNNRVVRNILYAKVNSTLQLTNQYAEDHVNYVSSSNIDTIGYIDSNFVAKPTNTATTIYTQAAKYNLAGWKAAHTNYDQNSKDGPVATYASAAVQDTSLLVLYNASKVAKVFRLNGKHYQGYNTTTWTNTKVQYLNDSITIQPYQSAILHRDTGIVNNNYQPPPQNPTVSITSPTNNAIYTAPASITISADASDPDGTISKVDFYNGTTLLNTKTSPPYTYNWTNVAANTYSITAKATDNTNNSTTSASVTVTVNPKTNSAPTITLTAPADGAKFTSPATVTITATANDPDGTVSFVTFKNGSTVLKIDSLSPYSFSWSGLGVGNYNITAVATDNSGATTVSNKADIVVGPAIFPTVTITSPSLNMTYISPASVTITATAIDSDGTVSNVKFYNGTTLLTTITSSPYTYNWTGVTAGTYTITATATDNASNTTTSGGINITVNNPPNKVPVVALTAPADLSQFATPTNITITATASDTDGTINNVGFYNGSTLLGTDNSSPYSFTWNSVPAGTYNISAKAIDNSGATTSSNSANVTVYVPNMPPTVSFTSPAVGASFTAPASVHFIATAADADGTIYRVLFYNGDSLIHTETASPYDWTWTNVKAGTYSITAVAIDNDSSTTATNALIVTVANPNSLPTVSVTDPLNGATFVAPVNIHLAASASDADGTIKRVNFFANNVLLHTENASPYGWYWDSVQAGTYTIVAEATDNLEGTSTSAGTPVVITVTPPSQLHPTVTLTKPLNEQIFYAPASVYMSATAAAYQGRKITRVDFYRGTTLLNRQYAAPYGFTWTSVPIGNYVLRATATDSGGFTGTTTLNISVVKKASSGVIKVSSTAVPVVQ